MLEIVFTGGPSTGKTSVIDFSVENLKQLGYKVILVPEAATHAIGSGIMPFGPNALPGKEYQDIILKRQRIEEETARYAAKLMGDDDVVILYDRGTLDGYAYVSDDVWNSVLKDAEVSHRDLLVKYDAVLYMESSSSFFTKENNQARYEADAEDAKQKGERVLKSYNTHDHLYVIQPREDIRDKQCEVLNIIQNLLGQPESILEQRKFVVSSVDVPSLAKLAKKVNITQNYIEENDGIQYRVRCIENNGEKSFHYNVQKNKEDGKRIVLKDEVISEEEYDRYLSAQNGEYNTIHKSRYSFVYKEQYFKLDLFPDGTILLEVNVTKENPNLEIPAFIDVIEEVTNKPEYRNISFAKRQEQKEKILH